MTEKIEQELDRIMILMGNHPSRVRNPIYGEERQLAKKLAKFAHNTAISEAIEKIKSEMDNRPTNFIYRDNVIEILEGLKIKP